MEVYLIFALIVLLAVGSVISIIAILGGEGKRSKLIQRLDEIKGVRRAGTTTLGGEKKGNLFGNILVACGAFILPKAEDKRRAYEKRLYAAGIYTERGTLIFLGVKILLPIGLLLITLLLSPILIKHQMILILSLVAALMLGVLGPLAFLRFRTAKRKKELLRGFPDALDLLAVCTEAGVGFDGAMKKVAEEMVITHKHISREFLHYIYENQIGIPKYEALRNLADRTAVDIIRAFVSLLIQSEKLGTSIVNTLRVYSDSMRTKRRQDAEIKAAKLPVLMIFPLLFLIFPSLYVVILGPAAIAIYRNIIEKWK